MCSKCAMNVYLSMIIYAFIVIIGIVLCVKINVYLGFILICAPPIILKIKSIIWNINYEKMLKRNNKKN
jgi:hypothetical protein